MKERSEKAASAASKPIEVVLEEFLEDQRARLKPGTVRKYEYIIELLQACLDGYACQGLDDAESELFERLHNAADQAHREFCQIFGPEKIAENVDEFLDYFMIRKVICGKELLRSAGTVIRKLGKWLREKGYVDDDEAEDMIDQGAEARKDLPAAEELAHMLADHADRTAPDCAKAIEDHFTIEVVSPGELLLTPMQGIEAMVVRVPKYISDACREGWTFSGAIGKTAEGWHILEAWNVYP